MLIQLVEDDIALSEGIALALQTQDCRVVKNGSLSAAKQFYEEERPELIILDINLPDGSGYEYIRWVRDTDSVFVPILVLTANDLEVDEVTGLALGADDYMTKPFHLAVLRVRVQALLRRVKMEAGSQTDKEAICRADAGADSWTGAGTACRMEVDDPDQRDREEAGQISGSVDWLSLDEADQTYPGVSIGTLGHTSGWDGVIYQDGEYLFDFDRIVFYHQGTEFFLSVNEQRLLRLFVSNPGRILTRELLMERLWPDNAGYVDENALSVTVNRLRKKLAVPKGKTSPIQTVYGQGYLWKRDDRKSSGKGGCRVP